jgi:AcrR family transcriptional regulator
MEKETLTIITTLGAPILVLIGGLITWFFKSKREELQAVEERALEKRIETYNELLHPLIVMFSNKTNQKIKDKAIAQIGSLEYRKANFNLITFGSDEMVTSYNNMMQSFYKNESENNPKLALKNFAGFLLSVRKDVYNKNTKLKDWDMLKFMITDIEKLID